MSCLQLLSLACDRQPQLYAAVVSRIVTCACSPHVPSPPTTHKATLQVVRKIPTPPRMVQLEVLHRGDQRQLGSPFCVKSRVLIRPEFMGCLLQSGLCKGHSKVINNLHKSLEPGKKSIKLTSRLLLVILAEFVSIGISQPGWSKGRSALSILLRLPCLGDGGETVTRGVFKKTAHDHV